MISRKKAVYELSQLADMLESIGDVVGGDEISSHVGTLEDIAVCIREEMLGRHWWGVDFTDYLKLHTAVREDLITPELEREIEHIEKSVSFTPSSREVDEIEKAKELIGEFGTDDVICDFCD